MIKLDLSRLPPSIVSILMRRGTELPPLQWHVNSNRLAKQTLDETHDYRELLHAEDLEDEGMAAAVRGLLYIWAGWLTDAQQAAKTAPEKERLYISALATRHAGKSETSKALFQKAGGHPIYKPLGHFAAQEIGLSVAPDLKRLRRVIDFGGSWEPYAFSDVYEETRVGKLDPAGERIVRSLQCCEFELLLTHCYEAATARRLART